VAVTLKELELTLIRLIITERMGVCFKIRMIPMPASIPLMTLDGK